jgi:cytochrome c-type biogenesis protein CcmH
VKRLLLIAMLLLACAAGWAKDAAPLADDPAVEKRLVAIADELRCLVCQNESLSGSRAELAQDLRRELRELIRAGKTDAEIREFMVSRYGDFVLYRPPVKPTTWLLWAGPFLLMVAGVAVLLVYLRRRGREVAGEALTEEETSRAQALLREGER